MTASIKPAGVPCRITDRHHLQDYQLPASQGTLLEVRRYLPEGEDALYGYVRFKDANNRRSAWIPVEHILVAPPGAAASSHCSVHPSAPMLNNVYTIMTHEMRRARDSGGSNLEFFDERLRRDVQCPCPIRWVHYVDRVTFSPWYYSPFDTLFSCFRWKRDCLYDMYLCPFSLQCFECAEDMKRSQRLLVRTLISRRCGAVVDDGSAMGMAVALKKEVDDNSADVAKGVLQQRVTASSPSSSQILPPPGLLLHPPGGREIYRDDATGVSLFELKGRQHAACLYTRCIFLLGKSFLENKLAGHDVDVYNFYAVCLHAGRHAPWMLDMINTWIPDKAKMASISAQTFDPMVFAGYFSWEDGVMSDNLACIAVLPCFATLGLGQFLIAASYELGYRRGAVGGPERPLSDLGLQAYRVYWRDVLYLWLAFRVCRVLEDDVGITPPSELLQSFDKAGEEQLSLQQHLLMKMEEANEAGDSLYGRTRSRLRAAAGNAKGDGAMSSVPAQRPSSSSPLATSQAPPYQGRWQYSRRLLPSNAAIQRCTTFIRYCIQQIEKLDDHQSQHHQRSSSRNGPSNTSTSVIVDDSSNGSSDGDDNDEEEEDSGVDSGADDTPPTISGGGTSAASYVAKRLNFGELSIDLKLTISQMSQEVKLEEQDVLDCLLWCGLMHRGTHEGSTCLKVPLRHVADMVERRCGCGGGGEKKTSSGQAAGSAVLGSTTIGGGSGAIARFDPAKLTLGRESRRRPRT